MTFIEPKAELVTTNIPLMHIENKGFVVETKYKTVEFLANCARTCYQSYGKSNVDNDLKLVKHLIKSGHHSVLEHLTITMRLVTSRMVTHELVRHRLASYSERSTRYCDSKNLHIVKPCWYENASEIARVFYATHMQEVENDYNHLIANGCTKENASSILPNDTATEIVVTANAREWRHIFKMRLDRAARPEMRQVMQLAKDEMLKIDGMDIVLRDGE